MPTGVYERTPLMKTGKHMVGRPPWNKGKVGIYSEETKQKIGRNNPNYRNGRTLGEKRESYMKSYNIQYKRKKRSNLIKIFGGKCVKCGITDFRVLQIDHIKGGGNEERRERRFLGLGNIYYKHVIDSYLKKENKYQLLCANCNWIKRWENNEIKGKKLLNGEK